MLKDHVEWRNRRLSKKITEKRQNEGCMTSYVKIGIWYEINIFFHIMSRFWHMASYSRHFAVFQWFFYLISCFVTLAWFLSNVDHGKSCSARLDTHFENKTFFISWPGFDVWRHIEKLFRKGRMTSINAVIRQKRYGK